ncbi:MAG: alpha/beta hydrolase [Candidatus Bathyarchaeota archaeon]
MITEKRFNTGDAEINYAVTDKDGPPLLLLHGTSNRWQAFQPIITELASRWKIYAPDFRGHGRSQHTENYGFGYYLEDTVRFMDNVIGEPAVIFGHSLGGRIATKLAAVYLEKVRAIILGDSSLNEPVPSDKMGKTFLESIKLIQKNQTYQNIFHAMQKASSQEFDPVYGLARAKNLSVLDTKLLRTIAENGMTLESPGSHFYGYHPEEHLTKIHCPVLILQAEHGMLSDAEVQKALDTLPEAYHVKLLDVPHEFLYKPVEPLLKALNAFLEAIRD